MSSGFPKSARTQKALLTDLLHPIAIGKTVAVLRLSPGMPPYMEGLAIIKSPGRGRDLYHVQFAGDPAPRERVIHPDYQRNAERFVEILRDLWRAYDAPDIDDFFPNPTE
jgi:hypothetical protein